MKSGDKYRPSNGSEGDIFMSQFCDRCKHNKETPCEIIGRTMACKIDDPSYPDEWVRAEDGLQIWEGVMGSKCTKFEAAALLGEDE